MPTLATDSESKERKSYRSNPQPRKNQPIMNNQFTLQELGLISNSLLLQMIDLDNKKSFGYEASIETLKALRLKVDQMAGQDRNI